MSNTILTILTVKYYVHYKFELTKFKLQYNMYIYIYIYNRHMRKIMKQYISFIFLFKKKKQLFIKFKKVYNFIRTKCKQN